MMTGTMGTTARLLHCCMFPAHLLQMQQMTDMGPVHPVPAIPGKFIIILYKDPVICCNLRIMEQPKDQMLRKPTLSIIRKMQQTKIEKRKNVPVQQKTNTLHPVLLKRVQQTCRN
jgi:hypothetical protein